PHHLAQRSDRGFGLGDQHERIAGESVALLDEPLRGLARLPNPLSDGLGQDRAAVQMRAYVFREVHPTTGAEVRTIPEQVRGELLLTEALIPRRCVSGRTPQRSNHTRRGDGSAWGVGRAAVTSARVLR